MNYKLPRNLALAALGLGALTGWWPTLYWPVGVLAAGLILGGIVVANPPLALYGVAFALPLVHNYLALGLGLLAAASWGITLFHRRDASLVATDLDLPLVFWVILLLVATATSVTPVGSLPDLAFHGVALGLYLAVVNIVKDRTQLYRVVLGMLGATTVASLVGIYQYIAKVPPPERGWVDMVHNPYLQARAFSTFGNPNVAASYLLLTAPLALALVMACTHYRKRLLFALVLGMAGLCMLLTFSRGGWAGLVVAGAALTFLINRRLFVILLVVTLIAGTALLQVDVVERRLAGIGGDDTSVQYRLTVWTEALLMIRDFWPSGVGLGHRAFMEVYPEYMLDRHKRPYHAHNQYLQLVIERGILALVIYGWIILRVFRRVLDVTKDGQDRLLAALSAAVAAGILGLLVMGLVDHVLYRPKVILTFWMVLGLGQAAARIARHPQPAGH
jgi:O-antigen ligase